MRRLVQGTAISHRYDSCPYLCREHPGPQCMKMVVGEMSCHGESVILGTKLAYYVWIRETTASSARQVGEAGQASQ